MVGSLLNTIIVRVPANEPVTAGASRCPLCDAKIALRDNIPVVSWCLLRGRCRSCDGPIPLAYPLVELGNVVLWLLAWDRFDWSWELLAYAPFFSVLLALSVIDLELYILPNRITYPSIVVSALGVVPLALTVSDDPGRLIRDAYVGGIGYALFLLITLVLYELIVRKEGMGMGDVKLAVLLGIWLGYVDPLLVLYGLMAACFAGLGVGLVVFVIRRASKPYPFGPWLALGAIVVIMYSERLLEAAN